MSTHIKCLIIICCLIGRLGTYDIKSTKIAVNVNGSEIKVTVNDNPEVSSVFFGTEINHECSLNYSFVQNVNNSTTFSLKMANNKVFENDDNLRIYGVFEFQDQVTTKYYDYKINEYGNGVNQDCPKDLEQDFGTTTCVPSDTLQNSRKYPCSGTLIFKEDFDNLELFNWTHEVRSRVRAKERDQEFVVYVDDKENTNIANGSLYLTATWTNYTKIPFRLKNCTSKNMDEDECKITKKGGSIVPPVQSAKLHTLNKFQFKYGRVEIRARMPIGDWLFPYLILQPANTISEDSFISHIRIAYARGNRYLQNADSLPVGGKVLFGSAVIWTIEGFTEYKNIKPHLRKMLYGDDFHNYTLIWHEDRIIYKVDGYTYGTIRNKEIVKEFSYNEYFIVLGLTAGGAVNFEKVNPSPFNNKSKAYVKYPAIFNEQTDRTSWKQPNLVIDYVHVYTTHPDEE